jgi:hypothetical protein
MVTAYYLIGWLLIGIAFVVMQTRFYDAHRKRYGLWRPGLEAMRTTLFYTPAERRAMMKATFRRDPEPSVERARQRYLIVIAVAAAYLLLAIPAAILFGP